MDNITNLQPQDENHEFQFKIQCSSCHESHPNTVAINQQVRPSEGSRGATGLARELGQRPGVCGFHLRDGSS